MLAAGDIRVKATESITKAKWLFLLFYIKNDISGLGNINWRSMTYMKGPCVMSNLEIIYETKKMLWSLQYTSWITGAFFIPIVVYRAFYDSRIYYFILSN